MIKHVKDKNKIQKFYEENYSEFTPDVELIKEHEYLGYFLDKKLIGLIAYKVFYNSIVELGQFVVDKSYRSSGYGTLLFKELQARLREKEYNKMIAYIFTHNWGSLHFFLREGFLVEGLMRNNFPDVDVYCVGKVL